MNLTNKLRHNYAMREQFFPNHLTLKEASMLVPFAVVSLRKKIKNGEMKAENVGTDKKPFFLVAKEELVKILPKGIIKI